MSHLCHNTLWNNYLKKILCLQKLTAELRIWTPDLNHSSRRTIPFAVSAALREWSNHKTRTCSTKLMVRYYFFLLTKRNNSMLAKQRSSEAAKQRSSEAAKQRSTILSQVQLWAAKVRSSTRVEKPLIKGLVFQKRHNQTIITQKEKKQGVHSSKCCQN